MLIPSKRLDKCSVESRDVEYFGQKAKSGNGGKKGSMEERKKKERKKKERKKERKNMKERNMKK